MAVNFSRSFVKALYKAVGATTAISIIKQLKETKATDGKFIALVKNISIREKKHNTFRFYLIQEKTTIEICTEEELKQHLLQFIALSKKNN